MRTANALPWWAKIAIKMILGLLPVSYEKIRNLFTGYRGNMEFPEYAQEVFGKFTKKRESLDETPPNGVVLELGPGGSLLSGLFAKAVGFDRCMLIDVGDFANPDPDLYKEWSKVLPSSDREKFLRELETSGADVTSALTSIGIEYYTNGLESLASVASGTVDFLFSNAVLEHVSYFEFSALAHELFRVSKEGSLQLHQIDYKDHLGGSLNNLRFPLWLWESRFFPNSGFYTNRLRHSQVCAFFEAAGFYLIEEEVQTWQELPIRRKKMAKDFRGFSDHDLSVNGAFLALRK